MERYRVVLEGECSGVSRDFDDIEDALNFVRELLKTNDALDGCKVCLMLM